MKKATRLTVLLPWFICALGALFYCYEYFLRVTPSVMTDDLARYFHIHDGSLGNLSAFYYYIYTPMQLVAGVLMDRYGPRRLLTIASLCCVLGSFLFAATPFLWMAEIGRFLIGFGSAFAFVGVLKLATIWLPNRYFAMFSGLATALGMVGAILGNLALTHLMSSVGWKMTVYSSGAFGIIVALLISIFVRDENLERKKVVASVSSIDMTSVLKNMWNIMKSRQMWIAGTIGGLIYLSTSAFAEMWGNPYLRAAHGLTNDQAATAISMIFAGGIFGYPIAGWISDALKRRNMPLVIGSILAAIVISIVLFDHGLSVLQLDVLLFAFGVLTGAEIISFAVGREISSPQAAGSAVAFINMVVMLSGVIFQPLIGYILDLLWNGAMVNGVQFFAVRDYQMALLCLPLSLMIAALMSRFLLKETYGETEAKLVATGIMSAESN